ncbi:related to glutathione transferase omega 1 [Cephalotrichum gorgonifer]|uniref:Related to glutathione transferase omega 1 n=1 Tax=Cephalotrichum gorgonifer TaxID=2041049 RepID=A0AAE8MYX4_9PEZI|nr:related to glutathione transferase omega 1 [Cephalotrichum gorgonifer]
MATPSIKLYTNHVCPWAHRAHIALAELNLPYEEEIIDLTVPRTKEYLAINPRGLVPSISYNGEIVTESAVVANLLADAHPSHLIPVSNAEGGALRRARITFFVETYFSKVHPLVIKATNSGDDVEVEALTTQFIDAVAKELEPLLSNAAPFFGGSERLTQAEVLTGSFVIRILTWAKHGILPEVFTAKLPERAPGFWKWAEAVAAHPSVRKEFPEERIVTHVKNRLAKAKAEKEKKA